MIRLADPKPAPDHILAYTGRGLDPESGLYFYRHRHFDPTVGRWLDREPIGCEADDAALHRYVSVRRIAWAAGGPAAGSWDHKGVRNVPDTFNLPIRTESGDEPCPQ